MNESIEYLLDKLQGLLDRFVDNCSGKNVEHFFLPNMSNIYN